MNPQDNPSFGKRVPRKVAVVRRANRHHADRWALSLRPVFQRLMREGHATNVALAVALNSEGIPMRRGGAWDARSISRIVSRLSTLGHRVAGREKAGAAHPPWSVTQRVLLDELRGGVRDYAVICRNVYKRAGYGTARTLMAAVRRNDPDGSWRRSVGLGAARGLRQIARW